jgi:hypothetical protein
VLYSNFGCCIGTIKKSETYKISGAVERREVPIRELVENKARQLKKKTGGWPPLNAPEMILTLFFPGGGGWPPLNAPEMILTLFFPGGAAPFGVKGAGFDFPSSSSHKIVSIPPTPSIPLTSTRLIRMIPNL